LCTVRSNTSVSVADRPALKQDFMATLCSFPPSMTYKENLLLKTSYNVTVYNVYVFTYTCSQKHNN